MRFGWLGLGLVSSVGLIGGFFAIQRCSDVREYFDLDEKALRDHGLIEKGWIPARFQRGFRIDHLIYSLDTNETCFSFAFVDRNRPNLGWIMEHVVPSTTELPSPRTRFPFFRKCGFDSSVREVQTKLMFRERGSTHFCVLDVRQAKGFCWHR